MKTIDEMTPEERDERTGFMLEFIRVNTQFAILSWAENNRNQWQILKNQTPPKKPEWHVATVELAYWEAVISALQN